MTRDTDPVHVVNGDSVARTLADSTVRGRVVVWRDVLCEGPVPPGDPATVRTARAAFLAQAGCGSAGAILADLEAADTALIAALDAGRETVLWFEHDLHDQLQLVQILSRVADHGKRDVTRLISIDRFPGHPRFAGLGELSSLELETLWPGRRPVAADAFAAAGDAYSSLQAGDAHALAELARAPCPGLPFLAAAIGRLLEEHPWARADLSRSERQILRAVAAGAHAPIDVFDATRQMEEAPYMGDTWLFRRIDDLAIRNRPLLRSTADRLALTPAGRAALDT